MQKSSAHSIAGGGTWQEFNYFFSFSFIYTRCSLCPHLCLAQRGCWVMTVPVLITGGRAPER